MSNFIVNNERQQYQTFDSVEQLNHAISIHMETLKENSCKEKIMKLLAIMSQHSLQILGVSWLGVSTMAEMLGVATRTIQRYTKELEALGIIKVIATVDKKRKGQTSNTYQILPIKQECRTTCHTSDHANLSINQTSELDQDHNKRMDETSSNQSELILPDYIPSQFATVASLICHEEKEIVELWSKVTLAYRKCNLDYDVQAYLHDVIGVLKGVVYKVKHGRIKNILGYFYRGVLAKFDTIFYDELMMVNS